MDYLKVTCPTCNKLYSVSPSSISSHQPEFQCFECNEYFWFKYPPADPNQIVSYKSVPEREEEAQEVSPQISPIAAEANVVTPSEPVVTTAAKPKESIRIPTPQKLPTCPSCKRPHHIGDRECAFCGVIFDKINNKPDAQRGENIAGSLQLKNLWQEVLEDYGSEAKHEAFIQTCLSQKQMPFASQQYRVMLEANPNDDIAQKMRNRIINLAMATYVPEKQERKVPSKFNFLTILMAVGVLFILTGVAFPQFRNLVGFGAMLLVISVGVRYYSTRI